MGSWNYLTIWRPVLPVFPRAHSASFLLSTLNSFQGCWKSAAAAAHDLILVEVDGKCQFVVDTTFITIGFKSDSMGFQSILLASDNVSVISHLILSLL